MLHLSIRNIFLAIFMFFLGSCQEYYNATLEKNQKEILVIEGGITNLPGPYTVTLSRALLFNEKYLSSNGIKDLETRAIVSISDNLGNKENLYEIKKGTYVTKANGIQGVIGRSYSLYVKTNDGSVYTSSIDKLEAAPVNPSLDAEIADKSTLEPLYDGSFQVVTKHGINININLQSPENKTSFYKFDPLVIVETYHLEWRFGRPTNPAAPPPPSTVVYCTSMFQLQDIPTVKATLEKDGVNQIKMHNLGFLQAAFYNPHDTDSVRDPRVTVGWLISCKTFSISEKEYLYYSKLRDQMNAKNKIFDPLPTQLVGNMICTNQPGKLVLGLFSVASQSIKYSFFKFNQYDLEAYKKDLTQDPLFNVPACFDDLPPSFWLRF